MSKRKNQIEEPGPGATAPESEIASAINPPRNDENAAAYDGAEAPTPEVKQPEFIKRRYVGKTIKHFEYEGRRYQLTPNSVISNLPAGAEQVKRLIQAGELITV